MTVRHIARRISTQVVSRLRAVLENVVRRLNGHRVTAAAYMASIGANADMIRRYATQVGKIATKIHRDLYAAEPPRNGLAVVTRHGQPALVRANTYPRAVLAEATGRYAKTAHLVNGGL